MIFYTMNAQELGRSPRDLREFCHGSMERSVGRWARCLEWRVWRVWVLRLRFNKLGLVLVRSRAHEMINVAVRCCKL